MVKGEVAEAGLLGSTLSAGEGLELETHFFMAACGRECGLVDSLLALALGALGSSPGSAACLSFPYL